MQDGDRCHYSVSNGAWLGNLRWRRPQHAVSRSADCHSSVLRQLRIRRSVSTSVFQILVVAQDERCTCTDQQAYYTAASAGFMTLSSPRNRRHPPPPVDEGRSQVDEPSTRRRLRSVPPPPLRPLTRRLIMHFVRNRRWIWELHVFWRTAARRFVRRICSLNRA